MATLTLKVGLKTLATGRTHLQAVYVAAAVNFWATHIWVLYLPTLEDESVVPDLLCLEVLHPPPETFFLDKTDMYLA
jgi:hypothetical protein